MKSFLHSNDVHVNMPLQDESGNNVDVVSAQYEVKDDNEAVVQNGTVESLSSPVMIKVLAENNTLPEGLSASVRSVTLIMKASDGNTYTNTSYYFINSNQALKPFSNSFVSFNGALALMPLMGDVSFNGDRQRLTAALIESYEEISRFPLNKSVFGSSNVKRVNWDNVPKSVLSDFRKAQVSHAASLMQEDPHSELREQGVFSKTVGQSSTTFFRSKPVEHGIHKRAWRLISRYVDNSVVVSR